MALCGPSFQKHGVDALLELIQLMELEYGDVIPGRVRWARWGLTELGLLDALSRVIAWPECESTIQLILHDVSVVVITIITVTTITLHGRTELIRNADGWDAIRVRCIAILQSRRLPLVDDGQEPECRRLRLWRFRQGWRSP